MRPSVARCLSLTKCMNNSASQKIKWTVWCFFLGLVLIEYLLFRRYILQEVAPFYPPNNDQVEYLTQAYRLYKNFVSDGIVRSLSQTHLMAQSFLFHIQAAFVFLWWGPSRLSALSINFMYFAAAQIYLFYLMRRLTGSFCFSFLVIGMLLSAHTFDWAADFRMDFISFCLYGLVTGLVLQSDVFLKRKLVILASFVSVVLVCMRFISATYLLVLTFVMLAGFSLEAFFSGSLREKKAAGKRVKNILIYGLVLALLISPILWAARHAIYNYYVIGHVIGAEKLMRLREELTSHHVSEYWFYPQVFMVNHFSRALSRRTVALVLVLLAGWIVARMVSFSKKTIPLQNRVQNRCALFLVAAVLSPVAVLTMDTSKSWVVVGIILIPFIYLVVLSVSRLYAGFEVVFPRTARFLLIFAGFYFMITGMDFYVHKSVPVKNNHSGSRDKNNVVTAMTDAIGDYAKMHGWKKVTGSSNRPRDYIFGPLAPFYFERHGVLLDAQFTLLGGSIQSTVTEAKAMSELARSDVYIDALGKYHPDAFFPFEQSVYPFRDHLTHYAEKNMVRLADYCIDGVVYRVYVRSRTFVNGMPI